MNRFLFRKHTHTHTHENDRSFGVASELYNVWHLNLHFIDSWHERHGLKTFLCVLKYNVWELLIIIISFDNNQEAS